MKAALNRVSNTYPKKIISIGIYSIHRPEAGLREGGFISLSPSYLEIGGEAERGYPEPFGLLEPPAQNIGCCCVAGYSFGAFFWFFRVSRFSPKTSGPPLDPLWTPPGPPLELPAPPPSPSRGGPGNPGFWCTRFQYSNGSSGSPLSVPWPTPPKSPTLACAYPASPLKLVLLTVLDLCLCLCLTRVVVDILQYSEEGTCRFRQSLFLRGPC